MLVNAVVVVVGLWLVLFCVLPEDEELEGETEDVVGCCCRGGKRG